MPRRGQIFPGPIPQAFYPATGSTIPVEAITDLTIEPTDQYDAFDTAGDANSILLAVPDGAKIAVPTAAVTDAVTFSTDPVIRAFGWIDADEGPVYFPLLVGSASTPSYTLTLDTQIMEGPLPGGSTNFDWFGSGFFSLMGADKILYVVSTAAVLSGAGSASLYHRIVY